MGFFWGGAVELGRNEKKNKGCEYIIEYLHPLSVSSFSLWCNVFIDTVAFWSYSIVEYTLASSAFALRNDKTGN